jgi:hypothetical protein
MKKKLYTTLDVLLASTPSSLADKIFKHSKYFDEFKFLLSNVDYGR